MNRLTNIYRTYLVPAFVIQSVLMAGGFGTGREIVEYFSSNGAVGALLGIALAFGIFALIISMTFSLSQKHSLYNYQGFFQELIGRYSFLYEIVYILTLVLVMSIVGAAAGTLLMQVFALPYFLGVFLLYAVVGILSFFGEDFVTRFLSVATVTVYLVLTLVIGVVLSGPGEEIIGKLATLDVEPGWYIDGSKFAFYNLAAIPGLLYCARHIDTHARAVKAGIIVGAVIMVPAVMLHLVILTRSPDVLQRELPIFWILERNGQDQVLYVYMLMLVVTFCATIIGLLQGLLTRIDAVFVSTGRGKISHTQSLLFSMVMIVSSLILSSVGLVALVARGYSILAYCILAIYIAPLLLRPVLRVIPRSKGR
jgi:uncharacterized membrane protein YkvI